jgi:hypothetical protein
MLSLMTAQKQYLTDCCRIQMLKINLCPVFKRKLQFFLIRKRIILGHSKQFNKSRQSQ